MALAELELGTPGTLPPFQMLRLQVYITIPGCCFHLPHSISKIFLLQVSLIYDWVTVSKATVSCQIETTFKVPYLLS